jgi:hypothetical protein
LHAASSMHLLSGVFILPILLVVPAVGGKNIFYALVEEACHSESQCQAGVVLASLNDINCLMRNTQFHSQIGLGPIPFGAQYFQAVLHWYQRCMTSLAVNQASTMNRAMKIGLGLASPARRKKPMLSVSRNENSSSSPCWNF